MPNRKPGLGGVLGGMLAAQSAFAQGDPLSVIDWVQRNPAADAEIVMPNQSLNPRASGAAVRETASGLPPNVEVEPLDQQTTRLIGLVPSRVSGLPPSVWQGSQPDRLDQMLTSLQTFKVPAAQSALYALLLTEAQSPGRDAEEADLFTLARVRTLMRFGALDPAMALIEQADVTRDAAHFAAYMDIALLTGAEDTACAVQTDRPALAPDLAHQVFCAVRTGDFALAALLFGSARSLEIFAPPVEAALSRFIDPELADGAAPLRVPIPTAVTPLLFRLHEAIGEPLPSRSLPLAYAVANLRDLAGWKAQLEAAERLARGGALPANRLLGYYSDRKPAASGGIWDRVASVQRLDKALAARSANDVSAALPAAWQAMHEADLAVPFAILFSPALDRIPATGSTRRIIWEMAQVLPTSTNGDTSVRSIPALVAAATSRSVASAVDLGFSDGAARSDLIALKRQNRQGEALLLALQLLENGAAGDPVSLAAGLGSLRALGQESIARDAAAQIIILGPYS
ncbi:MAG: hypothetical protein AAF636_06825 [Pseudomonadota bacterium]